MNDQQYIVYEGPYVKEVRCRGCGVLTLSNNKPTPAYAELVIAMRLPNGMFSKIETNMCKACRDRIVHDGPQQGELEAIFAIDIKHMIKHALRAGHPKARVLEIADRFVQWQPIRALDEPGRGER